MLETERDLRKAEKNIEVLVSIEQLWIEMVSSMTKYLFPGRVERTKSLNRPEQNNGASAADEE